MVPSFMHLLFSLFNFLFQELWQYLDADTEFLLYVMKGSHWLEIFWQLDGRWIMLYLWRRKFWNWLVLLTLCEVIQLLSWRHANLKRL